MAAYPEVYIIEQLSTLLQGMVIADETPVKRSWVNGGNAPSNPPTASLHSSDICTLPRSHYALSVGLDIAFRLVYVHRPTYIVERYSVILMVEDRSRL